MKILFITGTGTSVGKTVVAALLLQHLRDQGVHALAVKPFSSGDRCDALLLSCLQDGELTVDEVNPFFYEAPLAPWAAIKAGDEKAVPLAEAVRCIRKIAKRCEFLIVEGIGGVLVPLGHNYSVVDLIRALDVNVLLVAQNSLGTINYTRLTIMELLASGLSQFRTLLVRKDPRDLSSKSNAMVLRGLLPNEKFVEFPHLPGNLKEIAQIRKYRKKLQITLAAALAFANFSSLFRASEEKAGRQKRC